MIKTFLFYLGIFVIGSLIVSSIIDPQVYSNLKDKGTDIKNSLVNFVSAAGSGNSNKLKLIPSEMKELSLHKNTIKSCVAIEALGEMQGVSGVKKKGCIEACSYRDMDYSSYSCERDLYVCYCD